MRTRLWKAASVLGLVLALGPIATAHHSFCAEMDTTKPVLFAGKLTKIEWQNPHVYIYLSVKDLSGAVKEFGFHAGAPNRLIQEGWTRDMLKIGDEITVRGFLTKNGTPRGGLTALIYKGTSFQVNAPNC